MEETTTPLAGGTPPPSPAPEVTPTPAPEQTSPPPPPTEETQAMPPASETQPSPQTPGAPAPSEGGGKKWLIIVGAVIIIAGIAYMLLR